MGWEVPGTFQEETFELILGGRGRGTGSRGLGVDMPVANLILMVCCLHGWVEEIVH